MTEVVSEEAAFGPPTDARAPFAAVPSGARPGSDGDDRSGETTRAEDRLAPYAPAILALRWATISVSIVLASRELLAVEWLVGIWVALIGANTVFRTIRPFRYTGSTAANVVLGAELALHVSAVVTTGHWESSLVVLMINAVVIAGFARGFGFAIRVGVASTLIVTLSSMRSPDWDIDQAAQAAQWTTVLLAGGLIAGYTRRISGEASRRHSMALDRVARLADANSLLTDLHRLAQTLPASLDLAEVLESTVTRLKGLVDHDAAVVLTREEADGSWSIAHQRGLGISGELTPDLTPLAVEHAIGQQKLVRLRPGIADGATLGSLSRAGMYVPLLARGRMIGLLGVESRDPEGFTARDEQILRGFVEPVALAIDNARLFARIRTIGADEERTRIARDLHDRIGQSLAYLALEVDRIIRRDAAAEPNSANLGQLRDDIRSVIGEVRETLSDLRAEVKDDREFGEVVTDFATRVENRSGISIATEIETDRRLPILQEREMWRIAKEALVNVERHSGASSVLVRWRCGASGALLEVSDDGKGLPERSSHGRLGRSDSYGIVGMRERADSVGATLELISKPGEGTTVRCFLPQT